MTQTKELSTMDVGKTLLINTNHHTGVLSIRSTMTELSMELAMVQSKKVIVSKEGRKTDCRMIHIKEKDFNSKNSTETSRSMNELNGNATRAVEHTRITTRVGTLQEANKITTVEGT